MSSFLTSVGENSSSSQSLVVSISVFAMVLCIRIVIGQVIHKFRWFNESITALVIGCVSGTVILLVNKGRSYHILRFDEELFFTYLLPPIIFNAGFQVKRKQFFHNFLNIMLFGVIGVFISTAIISTGSWWLFPKVGFVGLQVQDYLAIGTIFSSTDTVCTLQVLHQDETPLLYSLIFGEGVVNDATSVVLFNAIKRIDISEINGWEALRILRSFLYLFSTSTALGVSVSLVTSYLIKTLYISRHSTDREIALMILLVYLSYMSAEVLQLSGILTVFFCGIVMSHYAWHNVSDHSRTTTRSIWDPVNRQPVLSDYRPGWLWCLEHYGLSMRYTFATMSFVAETFIFIYVGMDALDIEKWKVSNTSLRTSFEIDGIVVLLILVGRAAFIFPLSALSSYMSSDVGRTPITFKHQVIIWWAGLMRGAVSVALAFNQFTLSGVTWDTVHATMITSTLVVVLFTTLVFGLLTKPLLILLLPRHNHHSNHHLDNTPKDDVIVPLLSLEEPAETTFLQVQNSLSMLFERPVHTIHFYWRKFDDAYMRPVFGGPVCAVSRRG